MNPSPHTTEQPRPDRSWPQLAAPDAWTWAKIRHVSGHVVECDGLQAPLGAMCEIETDDPGTPNVPAEVVAFSDETLKLIPFSETVGSRGRAEFAWSIVVWVCQSAHIY
jgi:flagellar biosynthesis/type III secretory pathway ATPase